MSVFFTMQILLGNVDLRILFLFFFFENNFAKFVSR